MLVTLERSGAIAIVRLNRPERMNAVNTALRNELIDLLGKLNADASVKAVVITGAEQRAFCAGQDLEESSAIDPVQIPQWLNHQKAMYQAVRDLNKGCVVAFNGVAAGAGFQIGLCADLRVGHPEVRIGQPEVKAGLASVVGSFLMSLYVGQGINRQMSLTGELIDGQRAYELGLLNLLVPRERVLPKAIEEAEKLAAVPPTAMRLTKERFRLLTQPGFDDACNAVIRYHLENYASGEPQAAQKAFLEARRTRGK
ncbi:MAG: enoyl-CoA hydratase/isomerase family protein [Betaproteobacteria bacterium]|nr:enoyl-CoA hydratase/isomerase family protein [Betaproteobacteria bacterium]